MGQTFPVSSRKPPSIFLAFLRATITLNRTIGDLVAKPCFFSELKRRNVLRAGAAYVVGERLGKAVEYRDTGLSEIVGKPEFRNIQTDPRWPLFLESIGMLRALLDEIKLEVAVPQ